MGSSSGTRTRCLGCRSTHLLKPVAQEHADSIHAEAYLNAIARTIGLAHHTARVEPAGEQAVLIVERYDRVRAKGGTLSRLHQEDAAQALGLPWGANDKYESVNPQANLRAIARLLDRGRSVFSAEPSDRERLLALVTLNVVAGNTDAHAKNFSLMLPSIHEQGSQGWGARLADAYDLVPQSLLSLEQSPFAMRIGGSAQPNDVTVENICAEAEGWGMHRDRRGAGRRALLN